MRCLLAFTLLAVAALAAQAEPSWSVSPYTQPVMMGVRMVDRRVGYVVGGQNGVGAAVIKTEDGGQSFTRLPIGPAVLLTAIAGNSETNVVLSGLDVGGIGGGQYALNGSAFSNSSMPYGINYLNNQDIKLLPDGKNQTFVMPGTLGFWPESEEEEDVHTNVLLVSRDGGRSFPTENVVDLGLPSDRERINTRYMSIPSADVAYVSSGGWPRRAVGEEVMAGSRSLSERIELQQRGNGKAFSLRHSDKSHKSRPAKISEDYGYRGIVSLSTDGFKTWRNVLNSTEWYPQQICCPNPKTCYLLCENAWYGYVYKTSDGGNTWDLILFLDDATSLTTCAATSADEVFIGGGLLQREGINGTVFHSQDGGRTFNRTIVPDAYFMNFDFHDNQHGYAVAMNANGGSNFLWFRE